MTRREIALYKLASFSEKMQKRAEGGVFGATMKQNLPTLGLLGLTGLATGGLFGGEEGKWKRRLLAMLGLPATYAALLAAKKNSLGGLMPDNVGINGPSFVNRAADTFNNAVWSGVDTWKKSAPSPESVES